MALNFASFGLSNESITDPNPRIELLKFMNWLRDFFAEVVRAAQEELKFQQFFIPAFPALIGPAFEEFQRSEVFYIALRHIESADDYDRQIREHGLSGSQLAWKFWNVKHWLDRFIREEVYPLFGYLLKSINALLKSVLDNVPGGGAIIEFKEAIENSMDQTANPVMV